MNIPAITTDQMREVDRLMIEVYGIELIQMMENAGRHLASLAREYFFNGILLDKSVLVLAGSGGNGGGGFVAARRLQNWGVHVQVFTTKDSSDYTGVPQQQIRILTKMGIPVQFAGNIYELPESDLILDAIIGYSLQGAPTGHSANLIRMANQAGVPILSLDIPSGIDATSGKAFDPHICADATLTLAIPKIGMLEEDVKCSIGALFIGDISVPPQLYENLGLQVDPIFSEQEIIRI